MTREYIKNTLEDHSKFELDFSTNKRIHIMNENVMKFLIKSTKGNHSIIKLDLSSSEVNDQMMRELIKGNWEELD